MDTTRVTRAKVSITAPIMALCVVMAHLAMGATAAAGDQTRVLIVPLSGSAPGELADAPERLTRVLVRASRAHGADVTVAQASLDDTLAIVGCTARSASCLDQAAATLEVERIVFGRVEAGGEDGTLTVSITVANQGKSPVKRTFTVAAASVDEAEVEFAGQVKPMLGAGRARRREARDGSSSSRDRKPDDRPHRNIDRGGRKTSPEGGQAEGTRSGPPGDGQGSDGEGGTGGDQNDGQNSSQNPDTVDLQPKDEGQGGASWTSRLHLDRVERTSWVITGVGGGLMGTGMVFWILAADRQGKVDDAPASTAAELDNLVDLENGVRTRALLGNTLFLAGTVTAAIGLTFAIKQARTPESAPVTLTPVALGNGVGVVLGVGGL